MKIFKTIVYIFLTIVLVLVLLGFMGSKSFDVSRTVEINAPSALVFPYIKSLKKQNTWGPWIDEDPEMQISYEGEDGTVGFVSRWDGKKAGKGEQRISAVMGTTVESDLTFYMPWGTSTSTGYMHAADATAGSEVTWGIRGENDFISRIFSVFMNMDKGVGPMFDKGLQSLKTMVETDVTSAYKGHKVQVVDIPAREYIAAHAEVEISGISGFIGQQLPRITAALGKANITTVGAPCALYYTWDEVNGKTDVAIGIPVKSPALIPATEVISVSAGKALLINYFGPYEGRTHAHMAMDEFIQTTGVKTKFPTFEEYVTDPQSEPDSSKWLTKIYYLLDQ